MLGISYERTIALLSSGDLPAHRVGRNWHVEEADISAWIAGRVVPTGALGPTVAGGPRKDNRYLLDAVLALSGWDARRLSAALGVSLVRIEEWPTKGVPNAYVPRLRAILGND